MRAVPLSRWLIFFSIVAGGCAWTWPPSAGCSTGWECPPRPRHLVAVEGRRRLPDQLERRGAVRPGPGHCGSSSPPFPCSPPWRSSTGCSSPAPRRDLLLTLALSCVTAGIFGNLYDRLGLPGLRWNSTSALHHAGDPVHAVRDWILVMIGPWHWPNFNVADSLLVCGAALLVWHSFTMKPKRPQPRA